jgi:DNA repair exonuclease SbcCD ATPase subunit
MKLEKYLKKLENESDPVKIEQYRHKILFYGGGLFCGCDCKKQAEKIRVLTNNLSINNKASPCHNQCQELLDPLQTEVQTLKGKYNELLELNKFYQILIKKITINNSMNEKIKKIFAEIDEQLTIFKTKLVKYDLNAINIFLQLNDEVNKYLESNDK